MNISFKIFVFAILVVGLLACKSDPKTVIQMETILGNWDLISAKRNNKKTETLEKTVFEISKDQFAHNLNGDLTNYAYKFDQGTAKIEDDFLNKLHISKIQNDTMFASAKIRDFKFEFVMKRSTNE